MKKIKRGEIKLCDLGEGYGSIQGGVRPVLFVQNNKGNKYSPTAFCVLLLVKLDTKLNFQHTWY